MELYVIENQEEQNKKSNVLNHHLKHLEYISILEMQLEQRYGDECSWRFLVEFKAIKQEAQMNVLKLFSTNSEVTKH